MSTKFTPGPWKAHFEEAYYVTGPDLGRVAMMMNLKGRYGLGGRRTGEEAAANARLIAAAPAMYEALEQAELCIHGAWQMLSAINESEPSMDRDRASKRAAEGLLHVRAALAIARGEA